MGFDSSWMVGLRYREVVRGDYSWHFAFEAGTSLLAECPWRIIANGRIALGSIDDRQQFGLPAPIDAQVLAGELLRGEQVKEVVVVSVSSDLVLTFNGEQRLELFNNSSGYEGWTLSDPHGKRFIAQGGGQLVSFGG
jgi:hypothetical protein